MASSPLAEYQKKRDFSKTAEPAGEPSPAEKDHPLEFVIQKHAATALHFDLRLELDGVMKSWAVPKGPSFDPTVKRLAMQVEDHPMEYNTFEGTIPKGEYGGGTVMIWDRGTYTADEVGADGDEPEAVRAGLAAGKLAFTFHGERMHGSFALVRTKYNEQKKTQWLLIKHRDEYDTDVDPVAEYTTSVVTGRTMEEIAAGDPPKKVAAGKAMPKRAAARSAKTSEKGIEPMLATIGTSMPDGGGWTFEPKYDGIRVVAYGTPKQVALVTRNGIDKSRQFPGIAEALRTLAAKSRTPFVLDGEIVALQDDKPGRFQGLQNRMHLTHDGDIAEHEQSEPAAIIVFDLLADGDVSLLDEPWTKRRQALERRLKGATNSTIRLGETSPDGPGMLARAHADEWEGVIAKRTDARYDPGHRSRNWLKLKIEEQQEFVVGGWTDPRKSRVALGALLVGYYHDAKLIYAGHVGGGFTQDALKAMHKRLAPLERATSPFVSVPKTNEPAHWVDPKVVVEVKFIQWTDEGLLRQPVFLGVRDDKPARRVRREKESIQHADPPATKAKARFHAAHSAARNPLVEQLHEIENGGGDGTVRVGAVELDVSNLKKVFFPKDGYTKGDLLRYYATIADAILPTMADRPLVLKRFPNGIDGKPFYQQNAPAEVPDGVRVETIGEDERRFVGGSLVTLLYTIQLGAVSVDPWMARVQSIDTPDYTVIDLDPGPAATFDRVVKVARFVNEELDALGLHGAPKTSGASGIHIYVPLPSRTSEESARLIAQLIATRVHQAHPRETTIERSVKSRPADAVYVDYLQNIIGKTVAGVYAARAVDGAHVSTPLDWDELTDTLTPAMFTIETLPERLAKRGDLWAKHMARRNTAASLRKL
jgi:bifunctional non-homologous end joining protein LigD